MPTFNYDAARRSGYSDEQIQQFLKQKGDGVQVNRSVQEDRPSFWERAGKVAVAVGDFIGSKEFGQGLGQAAAQFSGDVRNARKSEENLTKVNENLIRAALKKPIGDPERTRMLQQAGQTFSEQSQRATDSTSDLVSNKQFIGSAAATALNVGSAGMAPKGKFVTDVARFSGLGGAMGAAESVRKEDKTAMELLSRTGTGALIGAIFPTLSATKRGIGSLTQKTGQKIGASVIRPSASDISDGFKMENVYKYDVGGSLKQTMEKTTTRMNQLSDELNKTLTSVDGTPVDLDDVLRQTKEFFTGQKKLQNFGNTNSIKRVLDGLSDELDTLFPKESGISKEAQQAIQRIQGSANKMGAGGDIGATGFMPSTAAAPNLEGLSSRAKQEVQKYLDEAMGAFGKEFPAVPKAETGKLVNLYDATLIKRGAGTKGAWVFGASDPDSTATQKVYTKFYQVMKKVIEDNSPESLKGINKELSDLIPIQNAVIRRIPVAERNNLLGLTSNLGLYASVFDPRALVVVGGQMLTTSGRFGNELVKIGSRLKNTSTSGVQQGLRNVGRTGVIRGAVGADTSSPE